MTYSFLTVKLLKETPPLGPKFANSVKVRVKIAKTLRLNSIKKEYFVNFSTFLKEKTFGISGRMKVARILLKKNEPQSRKHLKKSKS